MKRFAIGSVLVASLAGCATSSDLDATRQQLDQVSQQANRRLSDVESKLSNDKLLDLVTEIDALKAEVAHMRGQLEEQNYTLQTTQKRQNDLYNDLDTRLAKLESASAPAARVPVSASAPAAQAAPSAQASPDFDRALNLLRNRDFANATVALQRFIEQNPDASQSVEASYWLGVAHAAQRQYDAAIDIHRRFVEAHPENSHAPDALRNIANCQRDLGQVDQARATLKRLIKLYPKSSAAIKGKEMLAHL